MKILSLGADLFHANRQTDITKLIVVFHIVANAPEIVVEEALSHD